MLPSFIRKFYPRAEENRVPVSHPSVKASRANFFKAAALNFTLLQLLFLGLFCYMFGSLFQQSSRTHSLKIVWVDYDGGVIGDAIRDAYQSLRSNSFPTLVERAAAEFPSQKDLREAVCSTSYWAALYITPGSSERLRSAISGSTSGYNQSNVLFYIWNEARYPTTLDSAIAGNLGILSNAARIAYAARNGTFALSTIPSNDSAALLAYANPWALSSINIQPTTQGSRTVYNTICIVLILIQDFFYLGSINGLYAQFKIYNKISPTRIIFTRDLISGTFTMIGSLLITGAIWAFKAGWEVSGKQFALNWLILWIFAHVNFLTIDVFTIWLPPQYIPMALVTWIVTNITSILIPFRLSSAFYRWAYALPAHEAYEALTDNWSSGCNPHLRFALPILFAYEILGLVLTAIGVFRRCHLAVVAEEAAQEAMRLRLEMAMKIESAKEAPAVAGGNSNNDDGLQKGANGEPSALEKAATHVEQIASKEMKIQPEADNKQYLNKRIEELGNEIVRMETRASQAGSMGPSFKVVGS